MIDPGEGNANARRGVVEWLVEFARSDNTGGVFYGWRLVLIGFLIILVGLNSCVLLHLIHILRL